MAPRPSPLSVVVAGGLRAWPPHGDAGFWALQPLAPWGLQGTRQCRVVTCPLSPQRSDPQLLAQFYHADEELSQVAAELDSLDGRKDPQRCTLLVSQFRSCQVSGGPVGMECGHLLWAPVGRAGRVLETGRGGHPEQDSTGTGVGEMARSQATLGPGTSGGGGGAWGPGTAGRVAGPSLGHHHFPLLKIPPGSPTASEASPA